MERELAFCSKCGRDVEFIKVFRLKEAERDGVSLAYNIDKTFCKECGTRVYNKKVSEEIIRHLADRKEDFLIKASLLQDEIDFHKKKLGV